MMSLIKLALFIGLFLALGVPVFGTEDKASTSSGLENCQLFGNKDRHPLATLNGLIASIPGKGHAGTHLFENETTVSGAELTVAPSAVSQDVWARIKELSPLWTHTLQDMGLGNQILIHRKSEYGSMNRGIYELQTPEGPAIMKVIFYKPVEDNASLTRSFLLEIRNALLAEQIGGPKVFGFGTLNTGDAITSGIFILQEKLFAEEGFEKFKTLGDRAAIRLLDLPRNRNLPEQIAFLIVDAMAKGIILTDLDIAFGSKGGMRVLDPGLWTLASEEPDKNDLLSYVAGMFLDGIRLGASLNWHYPSYGKSFALKYAKAFVQMAKNRLSQKQKALLKEALMFKNSSTNYDWEERLKKTLLELKLMTPEEQAKNLPDIALFNGLF